MCFGNEITNPNKLSQEIIDASNNFIPTLCDFKIEKDVLSEEKRRENNSSKADIRMNFVRDDMQVEKRNGVDFLLNLNGMPKCYYYALTNMDHGVIVHAP